MGYVSKIGYQAVIIDDNTDVSLYRPRGVGRGFESKNPEDYLQSGYTTPFPLPLIPRSEWTDRVEERERNKAKLRDLKQWAGFKSLNQSNTNYCWANGVVAAVHYARAQHGFEHVPLSPASVAAPIKNYRNVGGWGSQALEYIIQHGVAPQSDWPANAIDRKYDNAESKASRKRFKVEEWWELKPRNFDELATCLLYGVPVAVGYNWWGHEVMAHDLLVIGTDEYAIEIDNSWGGWGDNGHGVLKGSKALPDEAVAPRVITAYDP